MSRIEFVCLGLRGSSTTDKVRCILLDNGLAILPPKKMERDVSWYDIGNGYLCIEPNYIIPKVFTKPSNNLCTVGSNQRHARDELEWDELLKLVAVIV